MTDRFDDPDFREDDLREGEREPSDGGRPGSGPLDQPAKNTNALYPDDEASPSSYDNAMPVGGLINAPVVVPEGAETDQAINDDASLDDTSRDTPDTFELEPVHHELTPAEKRAQDAEQHPDGTSSDPS